MIYYRRYLGDYARDTAHLSMLEHGAYTLLLDLYYLNEQPLPDDEQRLLRLCRARSADEKEAVLIVLKEYFDLEPDGWHHKRCDEVIAQAKAKAEKAQKSANAMWDARKMRTHSERIPNASETDANASEPKCGGNASQKSEVRSQKSELTSQAAHTVVETPKSAREPAKIRAALPEDENPKTESPGADRRALVGSHPASGSSPDGSHPESVPSDNADQHGGSAATVHDVDKPPPVRNVAALVAQLAAKTTAAAPPPPADATPNRHGLLAKFLRDRHVVVTSNDGVLAEWIEMQVTEEQCLQAIELARCRKPEPEKIAARYLDPILRDVVAGKRNGQTVDRWWESEVATDRKAKELGITPTGYDTYATLRDKIRERLKGAA